jgi:hypothetical protein
MKVEWIFALLEYASTHMEPGPYVMYARVVLCSGPRWHRHLSGCMTVGLAMLF